MVSKFEKFDVSSLGFEEVRLSPKDCVLLPRVESGECPLFQLPFLVTYGVPKQSKFFPTDKDRLFVQIVLEGDVLKQFKAMDESLGSEVMRNQLFGFNTGPNYQYQPIIKEGPRGNHMKVKLQTNHETGNITTIVDSDGVTFEDFETLQGFEKHVPCNSTVKTILKMVKLWNINKKYGATFKLVRIGVQTKAPEPETKTIDFVD
jgi:hypothetical protein